MFTARCSPVPEPMRVSVVVPTYRRPDQLAKCLAGLRDQTRSPEEVIVVHRVDDAMTVEQLDAEPDVVAIAVTGPGVLTAMNAGVAASHGDVIAFIDDDAVARPEWIAGLLAHFAEARVGGVGGRDVVHSLPDPEVRNDGAVGQITRWGKLIGNHHLGRGAPRDVMVLKAVNMAFRREALALPRSLRGTGAQVHFEVAVGGWARVRGWRLVYDPEIVVDHFPGPRFDPDRRERPDPAATQDAAYNLVTALLESDPRLRLRLAAYGTIVGDAMTPGVVRALVAVAQRRPTVWRRLGPSIRGQRQAFRDRKDGLRLDMVPAAASAGGTLRGESNNKN